MMFLLWITFITFNLKNLVNAQDVQLSIENSTKTEYIGYVWSNSKFVFLNPNLKATAVKGKSVSEKICGFELTSPQSKTVPFIVYLVDELSGLGEIQVKPHIDLDHQKESIMMFTIEAYDCDPLPHYSNQVNVVIYISDSVGPSFKKNAYSFSVRKDSFIGTIVGKVEAQSSNGGEIQYAIYHAENLPFEVDKTGTIRTLHSLDSLNTSLIYLRVMATEQSKPVSRQSIISITIEIQPVCSNKLNGIPDQLDYKIRNGANNLAPVERLIQDQHQPRLIICDLPSPFKELSLEISLLRSHDASVSSTNIKVCYSDITTSRLQRSVCNADPGTIDLFLTQGGLISLSKDTDSIGPEVLPLLKEEFSLSWWMRRESKQRRQIFCFQNNDGTSESTVMISMVDCAIIISVSGTEQVVQVPASVCTLGTWLFYTVSQQWHMKTMIQVSVAGEVLQPLYLSQNILQQSNIRLSVGQCSQSSQEESQRQSLGKNKLQIGVISLGKEKALSAASVGCMSSCGEALLVSAEAMKKLSINSQEQRGSSLYFSSSSIPDMVKLLSVVKYTSPYYWSAWKHITDKDDTDVAIDLFVQCKSGERIVIPRTIIKVNLVSPQKEAANDTIEVDIYASSTIYAKAPQSIRLFPDFRFVSSITEEPVKKDLRIEACSVRPLQRNLVVNEKIYLSRLMVPMLMESTLKIKSDAASWNLEGESTAELYENLLRHVTFDMINERRKLFVFCTLKSGEFTSQAFVDVILPKKNKITIINEDHPTEVDQYSFNGRKRFNEQEDQYSKDHFDITKSKFIAIVIMAVVGGATLSIVAVAITCFVIRRRGNLMSRNRIKLNNLKSYQRELSPTFQSRPQSSTNPLSGCPDYEYDDDRVSMADLPEADEHCLDNISCDTCNMTDPENSCTNHCALKDIPRSKTINFPIIHKRF